MNLTKQIAAIVLLVLSVSVGRSQRPGIATPVWTPPPPRRAKTPFAPKPLPVHNIFKGDADVWLADAIEKLECGVAGPLQDKLLTHYVAMVGGHVAKHSVAPTRDYQFIITVDDSARASTAGGGRVYISVGMLRLLANEDELAAMLAHEIAHDAFHHPAKMVTRQMFWLTGTENINTPEEAEAALEELNDALDNPLIALGDRLL